MKLPQDPRVQVALVIGCALIICTFIWMLPTLDCVYSDIHDSHKTMMCLHGWRPI